MRDIIYVENRYFISSRENALRFHDYINKATHFIAFDDIDILVLDNARSYLSNGVINDCLDRNILILTCDNKHSPKAILSNAFANKKRLERLRNQLQLSYKSKNRLWRKIVMAKINNQADAVTFTVQDGTVHREIIELGKMVTEGDKDNREAVVARKYFRTLFGGNFKRGRFDDVINSALNYGYALVRAVIRRELAICGFEMSFGIHHMSTENPFNLSDDMIEVFRPFVDVLVFEIIVTNDVTVFDYEIKKLLVNIFLEKCVIDGKVMSLTDAVRVTIQSLITCLEDDSSAPLKLPSFIQEGK